MLDHLRIGAVAEDVAKSLATAALTGICVVTVVSLLRLAGCF
jgi:hypothetical protein